MSKLYFLMYICMKKTALYYSQKGSFNLVSYMLSHGFVLICSYQI